MDTKSKSVLSSKYLTTRSSKFAFRRATYEAHDLVSYPQGEWIELTEPTEKQLSRIYETSEEQETEENRSCKNEEERDTGSEEKDEKEWDKENVSEERRIKRVNILRGPIWNYGMRKLSSDKEYYDYILFGVPWATLKTPEDMILKGEKWIASKQITSSMAVFILKKIKKMSPEKTALVILGPNTHNGYIQLELETGRTLTYGELAKKVESLACGLHWMGVQPKQIMAIVSYHSLEAHMLVLACLLIGAVVALIDASLNSVDLGIVLRTTSPNLVFTEVGATLHKVEGAINNLEMSMHSAKLQLIINSTKMPESHHYLLFHQLFKEVNPEERTPGPRRADPLRPIMILYTGTLDNLKACLIAERYYTHSMAFVKSVLPSTDEPSITVLITPPMYCALAIKTVLNHYIDGHRIILCRGQIPEPCFITALRKFEVFAALTTRTTLMSLLDWPVRPRCPHLKLMAVVGVPLRLKNFIRVHEELFQKKVQLLQIYGLVETGTTAANTFLENKCGSVGKLFYNIEMKVLEQGTGLPLGPNQEGELCVRSPTMMLEYYNTQSDIQEAVDPEGFIHTGDLGYYDEQGFVYVTDRVREMIKWRTYLVSPSMIEELIMEQPEVKEAIVFGMFDEEVGELVTAAVILEFGHEEIDIASLEKRINGLLPIHRKIRGGIHVFQTFPRSTVGKPEKEHVLKEVLERKTTNRRKSSQ